MQAPPSDDPVFVPPEGLPTPLRRRLSARAASLDEVLARRDAGLVLPQSSAPPASVEALRAWAQSFSPGNAAALARRLTWDGLDAATAAWLVSDDDDRLLLAEPDAGWLDWLERILAHADDAAAALAAGSLEGVAPLNEEGLPYAEVLVPFLRAASDALDARLAPDRADLLAPAARDALARQLARELTMVLAIAVHERFVAWRDAVGAPAPDTSGNGGPSPAPDLYGFFVLSLLHEGLPALFEDLPVLARQAATVVARHVDRVDEFLARFAADREALVALADGSGGLAPILAIEPALSDPHDGRRRVMALTCANGARLVYKSRDVRMEAAFTELLDDLAAAGLAVPRGPRVLARDGYGWEEMVAPQAFETAAQVENYFRRAGGLLCVSWLLGARDLHMENVIATREGPVVIDLEALFEPGGAAPAGDGSEAAEEARVGGERPVGESCLATGLLTFVAGGPETPLQEVGGLRGRGAGTSTLARRVWTALGTAGIRYVEDRTMSAPERNAVLLDGVRQEPEAYAPALLDGFADVYRHVLAHRDRWASADGPLSAFAGLPTRVFSRDTNQYGMLLHVLFAPKYQESGVRRSTAYDVLVRRFAGAAARPDEWPAVRAERAALDALDVPRFTSATDALEVFAGGARVFERQGRQPGLHAAFDRCRSLSDADLHQQRAAVARVLDDLRTPRYGTALDVEVTPEDGWRACAEWIGREVIARGRWDGEGLSWHRTTVDARAFVLHDGALGPVLLLAALASVTRAEAFEDAARAALNGVTRAWQAPGAAASLPIGGTTGLGGLAYGLALAGDLLDDEALTRTALDVAAAITPGRIVMDALLDVTSGAAGAALALVALARATHAARLLDAAIACGDHLLAREHAEGDGGVWLTPAGYAYTGYAHGIAGIAAALARLADATGAERFRAGASRAYRRLHAARAGAPAWPMAVRPDGSTDREPFAMTAWCHGAPGILLALLEAPDEARDAGWREDVEAAARAIAAAPTHKTEHACCGTMGRAEALFSAGRRLGIAAAETAAARAASGVVARARRLGHVRLSAVPYDYRVFDIGFFRGAPGIGYGLLRMHTAGRLPNVLRLDTPGASWRLVAGT